MKARTILALTLVLSFVLGGIAMAASVDPLPVEMCQPALHMEDPVPYNAHDPWCIDTGDAYYECSQLVGEYDWAAAKRIGPRPGIWEEWVYMDHSELIEVIYTTFNKPPTSFDWKVDYNPLGTVIVKSVGKGQAPGGLEPRGWYMIYTYDGETTEDFGLTGYQGSYQIDHVTFCWNYVNGNGDLECYQEETAWGDGDRYVEQGNWATYFAYPDGPVDILAGQYMDAGYLTFGEPDDGWVEITVTLENGFVFYYDGADPYQDENLKVQDYEDVPPAENPAIGHFDWKASIEPGSTTATITVPVNNYYGVHLDVAYPIECPEEE